MDALDYGLIGFSVGCVFATTVSISVALVRIRAERAQIVHWIRFKAPGAYGPMPGDEIDYDIDRNQVADMIENFEHWK